MKFKRKIYPRGGSMETTIPKPLLFETEENEKYDLVFQYDGKAKKWYVEVQKRGT